jgi:hypothetical protein
METAGRLGHLTCEQQSAFEQFKIILSAQGAYDPAKHDDHLLLRFLRARKFVLNDASKMWLEREKWANEYGVDELLASFDFPQWDQVRQHYPRFYHKQDKFGRPIYIEHVGSLNVKKLLEVTDIDSLIKQFVYEYEKLLKYRFPACSAAANVYIEQTCSIFDLQGVALSEFPSVFNTIQRVSVIAQVRFLSLKLELLS